MLIAKVFLPMAMPGLASLGLGVMAVTSGTYNAAEVIAIVLGLAVVAIAGVFTIRSNVAKIWREQAEGEKARNDAMADEMKEMSKRHAAEIASLQASLNRALADLKVEKLKTDQTEVLKLLGSLHNDVILRLDKLDDDMRAKAGA